MPLRIELGHYEIHRCEVPNRCESVERLWILRRPRALKWASRPWESVGMTTHDCRTSPCQHHTVHLFRAVHLHICSCVFSRCAHLIILQTRSRWLKVSEKTTCHPRTSALDFPQEHSDDCLIVGGVRILQQVRDQFKERCSVKSANVIALVR